MRSIIFAACLVLAGMQPATLYACGYDNPNSIALGSLNWIYPDALYVRTAVSQAERAGLLPPDRPGVQSGPFALHRATSTMRSFGANLADPNMAKADSSISVVLIPQVMWTRFRINSEGVTVQVHAEGPLDGDLVVVTEEKVVRALVDGKLDLASAEENGLLRFYGNSEHIAKVRTALTNSSHADQALPTRSPRADPLAAPSAF